MSAESPRHSPTTEAFGFTEREDLFKRLSDRRFRQILADEQTLVHEISESYNNYGEFLFVNVSRPTPAGRLSVSLYGLGYHEYRERWYTDEWHWYRANNHAEQLEKTVNKADAERLIEERRATIAPYIHPQPRSGRARLFELLAELTDEDGAYIELEDMGDLADRLVPDDEEPPDISA
jgi:hypothetical protein